MPKQRTLATVLRGGSVVGACVVLMDCSETRAPGVVDSEMSGGRAVDVGAKPSKGGTAGASAGTGAAANGGGGTGGARAEGGTNQGGGGATAGAASPGAAAAGAAGAAGNGGGLGGGTIKFSTNFDLTEPSISEAQAWSTGLDAFQSPVSTADGIAFGTQTGAEIDAKNYNDSDAWLTGSFPADQRASAVIHKAPGLAGGYQEVEILLRWSVGALRTGLTYGETHSYGYEINLAWDGQYCLIARFKEPAFDSTMHGSPVSQLGVQDGDIFSAEIVGNKITATLTRHGTTTVIASAMDDTAQPFKTGAPGIGFYRGTSAGSVTNPKLFAFTSFTASAL